MEHSDRTTTDRPPGRRRRRLIIAVVATIVALPAAAYGVLAWSSKDAPAPARLDDSSATGTGGPDTPDGEWTFQPTPTTYAGYRIRERVGPVMAPSDAVGRTADVNGSMTIDGGRLMTLDVIVDMATLTSDTPRRDEHLRTNGLETDRFTTARFTVTKPARIGEPKRGDIISARIDGRLDLHGHTNDATFEVDARWTGPTIQIAGRSEIVLSDYHIDVGGFVGFSLAGTATVEFEMRLGRDGEASTATDQGQLADNPATPTASDDAIVCTAEETVALVDELLVMTYDGQPLVVGADGAITGVPGASTGAADLNGVTWSPDGSSVLAGGTLPGARSSRLLRIRSGRAPEAIGDLDGASQPDWGPDGDVVFVRRGAGDTTDIWIASADGTGGRLLVETPGFDRQPRWSPDGTAVVFTTLGGETNEDVMVVSRDGTGLRPVAASQSYEYAPAFTPDGRAVLFVQDGRIMRSSLAVGSSPTLVTAGPNDANPALSPDGSQLAFIRAGALHVAAPDGSDARCVATGGGVLGGPRWRP